MKYRKKPVIIEASQYLGPNNLLPEGMKLWPDERGFYGVSEGYIDTLEGRMSVQYGDWIIKDVKGEYYPCKPDIFEATYEEVN